MFQKKLSQKRRLQINLFVFLDFYVAALCNLGFTIWGSCIEQVWAPLVYSKQNFADTSFLLLFTICFFHGPRKSFNCMNTFKQKHISNKSVRPHSQKQDYIEVQGYMWYCRQVEMTDKK